MGNPELSEMAKGIEKLPPFIIPTLRSARSTCYWLIEPVDRLVRQVNHLKHYPPIALRRHIGHLSGFDGVSCEFVAYAKLLGGLVASSRVLDIGCGCGMLELELERALTEGECFGIDIHGPSIAWATRTIQQRAKNFHFIHADIYNAAYWPSGKLTARQFLDGIDIGQFDLVFAKSLFTHMLPDELDVYIGKIARWLRPAGKALLTFFLTNPIQEELAKRGKNQIEFTAPCEPGPYRVRHRNAPTAAVAYEESYILEVFQKHGLRTKIPADYGTWSGRTDGLSFQDILVAERIGS